MELKITGAKAKALAEVLGWGPSIGVFPSFSAGHDGKLGWRAVVDIDIRTDKKNKAVATIKFYEVTKDEDVPYGLRIF